MHFYLQASEDSKTNEQLKTLMRLNDYASVDLHVIIKISTML